MGGRAAQAWLVLGRRPAKCRPPKRVQQHWSQVWYRFPTLPALPATLLLLSPPPPPPPAAAQRPPRSSHAGPVLLTSLAFPPSDNQATHKGAPTSPSVCADCRNSVLPLWSPSALKWRPRAAMACMVASPCPTADARRRLAARVETTACGRKGATGVWAGARGLQATARRLRCQPPCAGPARKAGRLAALPSQPLPRCTYLQGRLHLLPQLWAAGTHPAH